MLKTLNLDSDANILFFSCPLRNSTDIKKAYSIYKA